MRPIILKGHERSLTMVKYNRDGDLLFSCSKDHVPSLWYSDTGERIGTYNGHNGAVWGCDISYHSKYLLTAAADSTVKLWEVETGKELYSFPHTGPTRSVNFAIGDHYFVSVADKLSGNPSTIFIYELAKDLKDQKKDPILRIPYPDSKGRFTSAYWMPLNRGILAACEDGSIHIYDVKTGDLISNHQIHTNEITNISFNKTKTLAITSSKDFTAKLIDIETRNVLKTYETDRPVNSAAISPLKQHVVLGGGQEAMSVTTAGSVGKFEAKFFHMIYAEEFGRVKGHFGPINTIAFAPNGKSYASGGEDGYIRLHHFDEDYLKMEDK